MQFFFMKFYDAKNQIMFLYICNPNLLFFLQKKVTTEKQLHHQKFLLPYQHAAFTSNIVRNSLFKKLVRNKKSASSTFSSYYYVTPSSKCREAFVEQA